MCGAECLRFVSTADVVVEDFPWGPHAWFVRPGLTASEHLMAVKVSMRLFSDRTHALTTRGVANCWPLRASARLPRASGQCYNHFKQKFDTPISG